MNITYIIMFHQIILLRRIVCPTICTDNFTFFVGDLSCAFLRSQLTCIVSVFLSYVSCQHGEGGVVLFHHY